MQIGKKWKYKYEREKGVGKGEQKQLQIGPRTCPLKRPQDVIFIFVHCTNTFFSFTSSCVLFLPIPISSHHVRRNAYRFRLLVTSRRNLRSASSAAGGGPSEPIRIPETARLEHLRPVLEEPDTPSFAVTVQLQPRA